MNIEQIIKPETPLERQIISDPEFIKGVTYGKPRPGHPEGEVIYHIKDVLANIDSFNEDDDDREKLRLIAIIHDTFKYKVDRTQPKTGDNHHARIARKFAEKYIKDIDVLQIIETHDDAYNIWNRAMRNGDWSKAEYKIKNLIESLNYPYLYAAFYEADNSTGNKQSESYDWFITIFNEDE